jgi:hypothetical protein
MATQPKKEKRIKIYIEGYEPKSLTPKILEKIDEHYKFLNTFVQLFSPSGIFNIENNKIIKQIPNDKPSKRIVFDETTTLLLDESFFEEENVFSQIPMHNSYKQLTQFNYCLGDDSKLYLIIEGVFCSAATTNNISLKKQDAKGKQKYSGFIPENFYFLAKEEIDNYLIKKELNGFLLMLK